LAGLDSLAPKTETKSLNRLMVMNTNLRSLRSLLLAATMIAATKLPAATFTVDPGAPWLGYMNVFNVAGPGYGMAGAGGYAFGNPWGVADLNTSWSGPVLTLSPNTIGDPNPYWYTPSGGPGAVGNKIMDANLYQEYTGSLHGTLVTFTGIVLGNTLANGPVDAAGRGWTSVAFIKDFAPDYSSYVPSVVPLTPGVFSVSLATINDSNRHVQFGFETIGPDVWFTDVGPYGSIQITAIPEPAMATLAGLGAAALLLRRRR
jgi:hypothetical protein